MDPRVREDDEITPSFLRYYTSFLRRQESIPEPLGRKGWIPAFARMTDGSRVR
jgi:hypothetical protein